MATTLDFMDIRVPALGESIREAVIARWLKQVGEHAADGEAVAELETDKVTVELRAPAEGVLRERKYAEGDTVKIGDVVALMEPGKGLGTVAAPKAEPVKVVEQKAEAAAAPVVSQTQTQTASGHAAANGEHLQAIASRPPSPALRKAMRESGVSEVPAASVARAASTPAVAEPVVAPPHPVDERQRENVVPMSPLRRRIAERLVQAQHSAAALTTFNEIDMANVLALRERFKETFLQKHGVKLGLMSFFTRAVVTTLKDFPGLNAELRGDAIVYKQHYDIGVAVGGGKGLVVPVVRDADRMSFAAIEQKIGELGKKAKENRLTVDELQGGTFTITNGGVYGSMMSTPLLNFPQTGILGMHNTVKRAVVVGDKIEVRPMMYIALTYDHRVVDGREAVQFLVGVKERIESPERLMLDL